MKWIYLASDYRSRRDLMLRRRKAGQGDWEATSEVGKKNKTRMGDAPEVYGEVSTAQGWRELVVIKSLWEFK